MRRVFFDLDGTLLESRPRLYRLFSDLVPGHGFSFDEYWHLKRSKVNHRAMLIQMMGKTERQFEEFHESWMRLIEDPSYLTLDAPFEEVDKMLLDLRSMDACLYIVTARQSRERAHRQVQSFGWSSLVDELLVTEQNSGKAALIESAVTSLSPRDVIVGDTGKDVECGKQLNLVTVSVLTGFLSRESLEPYGADHIVEKVTDVDFSNI